MKYIGFLVVLATWNLVFSSKAQARFAQASRSYIVNGSYYTAINFSNVISDGTLGPRDIVEHLRDFEKWKYKMLQSRGLIDEAKEKLARATVQAAYDRGTLRNPLILSLEQALAEHEPLLFCDEIMVLVKSKYDPERRIFQETNPGKIVGMFAMDRLGQIDAFFARIIANFGGPDFTRLLPEERLNIHLVHPRPAPVSDARAIVRHWYPALRGPKVKYEKGGTALLTGLVIDKEDPNITPADLAYLAYLNGWYDTGAIVQRNGMTIVTQPAKFIAEGIGARGRLYRATMDLTPQADQLGVTEWEDPHFPGRKVQILGADGDEIRQGLPLKLEDRIDTTKIRVGPLYQEDYNPDGSLVRTLLEPLTDFSPSTTLYDCAKRLGYRGRKKPIPASE